MDVLKSIHIKQMFFYVKIIFEKKILTLKQRRERRGLFKGYRNESEGQRDRTIQYLLCSATYYRQFSTDIKMKKFHIKSSFIIFLIILENCL